MDVFAVFALITLILGAIRFGYDIGKDIIPGMKKTQNNRPQCSIAGGHFD